MGINRIVLSGNVAAEPTKRGSKENPVLAFRIINNVRTKKDNEWQDLPVAMSCVIFGKRAISLGTIINKGMPLTVEGVLYPNNWQDDQGNKHYDYEIRVSEIVLPPKATDNEANNIPF